MPRYRKKPVVIEARRWDGTPGNATELIAWCGGRYFGSVPFEAPARFTIHTLEGSMQVTPGDFIIRGVQGEFYPCRADIFAATYEPVEGA